MGFAKYFNRDLIALNKLISSKSDDVFKGIIENHLISIELDEQINQPSEAYDCSELLIRILCRFYPKIKLGANSNVNLIQINKLKKLAKEINSNIEFADNKVLPTFIISLSKEICSDENVPHLYLGSNGWLAKLSQNKPLVFEITNNPFGAILVACMAASNVFRYVFKDQLKLPLDTEIELSAFNFSVSENAGPSIENVKLANVTLVGIGAIGSATVWTLSKLKNLSGTITLVDHEGVEESNLQRYILLKEKDITKKKVDVALQNLRRNHLKIIPEKTEWGEFIHKKQNGNCISRLVAVAVDSKEHRIYIQSSLPKKIINAYTDESRFGITRHPDFNSNVCLSCLYIPTIQQKSKLEIIVEELKMKGQEDLIYSYMQPDKFIDDNFLKIFSNKNSIPIEDMQAYKNKSFGDFYLSMVCGYKMLEIQESGQKSELIDVPLSFQSCMAGIMLAAEIVVESLGLCRVNVRDVSQLQVLDVIGENNPSHLSRIKNYNGKCICGDKDYQDAYRLKWGE